MKTIIYITSRRLLPLNSGDKLLTYNILKQLSKYYDIYLLNLNEGEKYTDDEITEISKITLNTQILSIRNKHSIYRLFKSMVLNKMYWKIKLRDKPIQSKVNNFIEAHPDANLVIWDHLRSSLYFTENKNKNILIEHNNEADVIKSRMNRSKNKILKYFLRKQSNLMVHYIKNIHEKMNEVIYISENDFAAYNKEYPEKYHLMNRLILDFSHENYHVRNNDNNVTKILFVGSLDWYPNIEAIYWFLQDVFPSLQKNGEYIVNIVGRDPDKKLIEYINSIPNVSLYSNVPSVDEYYLSSDILIIPIKSGSGINIKVLEALSYGIPIVMTSFAKRGYTGLEFIVNADTPDMFINEIHNLKKIELRKKFHDLEIEYFKQYQIQSEEILNRLINEG